jgi:predicted component of type VI protein secretion system
VSTDAIYSVCDALRSAAEDIAAAIKAQTEEFRALRIALTGGDQQNSALAMPGRVEYPFCMTCNCHHHPDNDNCILRGGRGVEDIFRNAVAPQESQAEDIAAVMAGLQPEPKPEPAADPTPEPAPEPQS